MTIRLSNLQINALRLFAGKKQVMSLEDFQALDQRITSGLGKRKIPYLERIGQDAFALTHEGQEALQVFEQTDVFRKLARASIAHVFDTPKRYRGRILNFKRKRRLRAA